MMGAPNPSREGTLTYLFAHMSSRGYYSTQGSHERLRSQPRKSLSSPYVFVQGSHERLRSQPQKFLSTLYVFVQGSHEHLRSHPWISLSSMDGLTISMDVDYPRMALSSSQDRRIPYLRLEPIDTPFGATTRCGNIT